MSAVSLWRSPTLWPAKPGALWLRRPVQFRCSLLNGTRGPPGQAPSEAMAPGPVRGPGRTRSRPPQGRATRAKSACRATLQGRWSDCVYQITKNHIDTARGQRARAARQRRAALPKQGGSAPWRLGTRAVTVLQCSSRSRNMQNI